jgi:Icc-related predicted phosphoesterase
MTTPKKKVRLAVTGDTHCGKSSAGTLQPVFAQIADRADALLLCGDLTDYGLPEEAHILVRELAAVKMPIVAVLGNHDFESRKQNDICHILSDAGVKVLDGDAVEIHGIGIAGVKGFVGGFNQHVLKPWGEDSLKAMVHEAVDEALKLESALARLRTPQQIALLHYAPISATVEGEPREIFPFLGCGRLEEPLNRYNVTAVFHGHAHQGKPQGKTKNNVPVYNVSMPLLRRTYPDRPPFHIEEITVGPRSAPAEVAHATA